MKKIALVTGGSRGIGRATCIELAKELNCYVIINYLSNEEAAKETLNLINGQGEIRKFDVANYDEVQLQIKDILKKHEKIDILVNNAGILADKIFIALTPEEWHNVINISLHGFFNVTHPILNSMIRNRIPGVIVSMSSTAAQVPSPGQSNYAASRAGLQAASRSIAAECAGFGIRINVVAAGLIGTDFIKNSPIAPIQAKTPMKRIGTAEEVAHVITFLCSDKASYITGQTINVNGGLI